MKFIPSFAFMVRSRLKKRNFLYNFYFKDKKTLDVGCGNGEFMLLDNTKMQEIDPNKEVIESLKNEGFTVQAASANSLSYSDQEFERVHCRNFIEHLYPDVAYKMLRELARVFVSWGFLILETEVITNSFWGTFGHTKPHPPGVIKKLLRGDTREKFESLRNLEYRGTFYLRHYFKFPSLYFMSSLIAYYVPFFRREYFLIIRKI